MGGRGSVCAVGAKCRCVYVCVCDYEDHTFRSKSLLQLGTENRSFFQVSSEGRDQPDSHMATVTEEQGPPKSTDGGGGEEGARLCPGSQGGGVRGREGGS